MSWYDRDYARPHTHPSRTIIPGLPLFGASVVTTLIIVNVVIHVLGVLLPIQGVLYDVGALVPDSVLHGQVWRLVTAQYLHAGTMHLLLNMLALHLLGTQLEYLWGRQRFFAIYALAGLAGSLGIVLLAVMGAIAPDTVAVGASGCILGLLGAAAVLFPTQSIYVYGIFPIRIRTAAMIFAGLYVLNIVGRGANYGGDAAHLAGLAFGAWWAWAGQRWWDGWAARRGPPASRPRRRTSPFTRRVQQRADDARLVDAILEKVHREGMHRLTRAERRALDAATERQRQAEARAGRTDRL